MNVGIKGHVDRQRLRGLDAWGKPMEVMFFPVCLVEWVWQLRSVSADRTRPQKRREQYGTVWQCATCKRGTGPFLECTVEGLNLGTVFFVGV